ncbi:PQQ-binding-like beta-propeller repeat protein [Candidatus Woesearchaeota archaeon]|nr:PQQ-binding-like beta-propeller repeat protein [Candidatus Woesearchaeota archaeon]
MDHSVEELRQYILDEGIRFNEGINTDGSPKQWLIDSRKILLDPKGARLISKEFYEKLRRFESKYVAGLTMAGTLLVSHLISISSRKEKRIDGLLLRYKNKELGLQKQIEGYYEPGSSVVIVDDIIRENGLIFKAIEISEKYKLKVEGVIGLLNFDKKGAEDLIRKGYKVEYLFDLEQLFIKNQIGKEKTVKPIKLWSLSFHNSENVSTQKSYPIIYKNSILLGTNEGKFLSINKKTGKVEWNLKLNTGRTKGIVSTPCQDKKSIYFGAYDGNLYCVGAEDGKILWKKKDGDWISSSPCIYEGKIFVGIGYGARGGVFCAYSNVDGRRLWKLRCRHHIHSSPCVNKRRGLVYIGSDDKFVYATDSKTGKVIWKFRTESKMRGRFVFDEVSSCLYFGSDDGNVYCLDDRDGKLKWKKRIGTAVRSIPEIVDDKLVISSFSDKIFCFNKNNGHINWYYTTKDNIFSSTYTINGIIYCGSNDRFLYVINLHSGELLTKIYLGDHIYTKPLIDKNVVYIRCNRSFKTISLNEYQVLEPEEIRSIYRKKFFMFDITYRCNDKCDFCCNQYLLDKAKKYQHRGEMTFEEIKDNLNYVTTKYDIKSMIITGGEPTIHVDFWKILDLFFNNDFDFFISLDTNAIKFADQNEYMKLYDFLSSCKSKKRGLELSLTSINNVDSMNEFEKNKLKGVMNAMKACLKTGRQVRVFILFTQKNYKVLPTVIDLVLDEVDKYENPKVVIETGFLSLWISQKQIEKCSIKDYYQIHSHVVSALNKIIKNNKVRLNLMMPLCLIKDDVPIEKFIFHEKIVEDSQDVLKANVWNKKPEFEKVNLFVRRNKWKDSNLVFKYCVKCTLNKYCNKIKEDYLKLGIVKKLFPFKDDLSKIRERGDGKKGIDLAIFDITAKCNDKCKFCCVSQFIESSRQYHHKGQMSLGQVKDNFNYALSIFNPRVLLVAGGEPTTHPEFWKILDFTFNNGSDKQINLATNGLFFSKQDNNERLINLLKKCSGKNRRIELSLSTINSINGMSDYEKKKLKGVLNVLHACLSNKIQSKISIFVTKDNHKILSRLIHNICETVNRYNNPLVSIEFGLLSLSISEEQIISSSPSKLSDVYGSVVECVNILISQNKIRPSLTNLPFCLLYNDVPIASMMKINNFIDNNTEMRLFNYFEQKSDCRHLKNWTRKTLGKNSDIVDRYCKECLLNNECNRIKEEYLNLGIIDELKPLKDYNCLNHTSVRVFKTNYTY